MVKIIFVSAPSSSLCSTIRLLSALACSVSYPPLLIQHPQFLPCITSQRFTFLLLNQCHYNIHLFSTLQECWFKNSINMTVTILFAAQFFNDVKRWQKHSLWGNLFFVRQLTCVYSKISIPTSYSLCLLTNHLLSLKLELIQYMLFYSLYFICLM